MSLPSLRALFSFPNPVNDVSARLVAGGVVVMPSSPSPPTSRGSSQ
jgi:hypothetical protein